MDLEQRRPVDLLPDRTAETLRKWLQAHPGVTVISRDRAGAYADGARRGAPQALPVADRWPLLKNLREAVERLISHPYDLVQHVAHEQTAEQPHSAAAPPLSVLAPSRLRLPPPPVSLPLLLSSPRPSRATAQPQRVARYQCVQDLHRQGKPILQIARQLRRARKTVRRYLQADTFPARAPRPSGRRQIAPFLPYLRQRWQAGCQVATTLWRELVAPGFTGSFPAVARVVKPWRVAAGTPNAPPSRDPPSPRQVSWWLLEWLKPKSHNATAATSPAAAPGHRPDRRRLIQALCERCPAIPHAQQLGNAFIALVREHRPQDLNAWISAVLASGLGELIGFASGLLTDQAAVIAALSLPWSNGQTEGQINRLKVIKRQMYGRAKLDLLKVRVLHPP